MLHYPDDTICAPATAKGNAAIALIRMSGAESLKIFQKCFSLTVNYKPPVEITPRKAYLGYIIHKNIVIDQVIGIYFKKPASYSGEDMIEISCHGSEYIQQKIIECLVDLGARTALPGEFTMRAFLNKKIDLSQAEAIADLIAAQSAVSHQIALNQMRGGFSNELKILRQKLLETSALFELELDFSEEDIEFADRQQLTGLLENILKQVTKLAESFAYGNAVKNGVPVAIVGRPNVGKSTLLNLFLKEEKAIVSEIAGTTRDAIEDTIVMQGICFRFIDTAGLRHTTDEIETKGIHIALRKIDQASVILLLVDATHSIDEISESVHYVKKRISGKHKSLIIVVNKSDKIANATILAEEIRKITKTEFVIPVSAKNHENIDTLQSLLLKIAGAGKSTEYDIIVTNSRHYEALTGTANAIKRALENLKICIPQEFIVQDIRQAIHFLGLITGEISTEEQLDYIFSRFCIGK